MRDRRARSPCVGPWATYSLAATLGMPSFVPAYVFPSKDGAPDPRSEEILEAAAQFLWSDEMATSLEAFTENHKEMFVGATPDGEQKLEWTQAHLDFQQLFEHQLEQFVAQQDFTQEDFLAAAQARATTAGRGLGCSEQLIRAAWCRRAGRVGPW